MSSLPSFFLSNRTRKVSALGVALGSFVLAGMTGCSTTPENKAEQKAERASNRVETKVDQKTDTIIDTTIDKGLDRIFR